MPIFKRNLTSEILEDAASIFIESGDNNLSILEIGCGDGNISRNLSEKYPDNNFYASDISDEAIASAKNLDLKKMIDFRVSNGFDEWLDSKFDLVICDVSAISEVIADLSDWYDGVSCKTGKDGLGIVLPIIENVKKIMNKEGCFIMPVISLCNVGLQKNSLSNTFSSVKYSNRKEWPLPKDLLTKFEKNFIDLDSDFLDVKERFGMIIAYTFSATCFYEGEE
jgi:methylase of polypeptide subunit release factors